MFWSKSSDRSSVESRFIDAQEVAAGRPMLAGRSARFFPFVMSRGAPL
jgi:hypothetical protein